MQISTSLSTFSKSESEALLQTLTAEKQRRQTENRLAYYKPYPKQLSFHTAGATVRERLLMAANQSGKSFAGGMEAAMHATGIYPNWWKGRRFEGPTIGWVCGQTNEQVRDVAQRVLVGRPGSLGTGALPKESILEPVSGRGISDLLDNVRVQHVSGGVSTIGFKSYISGRERFQVKLSIGRGWTKNAILKSLPKF
jgi:phage terminase large subunit-like protein